MTTSVQHAVITLANNMLYTAKVQNHTAALISPNPADPTLPIHDCCSLEIRVNDVVGDVHDDGLTLRFVA